MSDVIYGVVVVIDVIRNKIWIYGLELCGLLCCFYQLLGLSFWQHPFTAGDPLVSKSWKMYPNPMKKHTHLHPERPEGKYIFSIPRDRYWGLQIHINSFIKAGITNLISHTSCIVGRGCFFKDKCTDCMRKKWPSSTVSQINIGCCRFVIGLFA